MEYGLTSLLPPLVAIALALATHRVLLPMAAGTIVGAALLTGPLTEFGWFYRVLVRFGHSIYESVTSLDHLMVLSFTMLLGSMVGVMESTGTMRRAVGLMASRVKESRSGQTLIAATGLVVFFDDYANTLLVGGTMQSTADRLHISRAKLAYLVDSTAAPVAGLAVVSTWVATEISYLQAGIDASANGGDLNAFEFFIASIPYRFYPWLAIAFVFIIARTGRDFGPMRREELKMHQATTRTNSSSAEPETTHWFRTVTFAIMPVLVCLLVVTATLLVTGYQAVRSDGPPLPAPASGLPAPATWLPAPATWLPAPATWLTVFSKMGVREWADLVGSGDCYLALVLGGASGLLSALAIGSLAVQQPSKVLVGGIRTGCVQMMPAMGVLWLAWALSAMTEQLDTGGYLASILTDRLDVRWLPTCVFVLGGAIAFATGTSWGTMAILTPIAVSLVLDMQGGPEVASPIALATFGSVLAGAIFGDHCSPISDTTILSSRASGCDHVVHVTTQMPYALLVGGVCILTGTIPVAFGVPVWVCLPIGGTTLYAVVRLFVRPISTERSV